MIESLPFTSVKKNFDKLIEQFEGNIFARPVAVIRKGKPVMAMMSWDLYEEILETLEVMLDEDLMLSLRKDLRNINHVRMTEDGEFIDDYKIVAS